MNYLKYLKEDIISAEDAINIIGGEEWVKSNFMDATSASDAIVKYLTQLRTIQYPEQLNMTDLFYKLNLLFQDNIFQNVCVCEDKYTGFDSIDAKDRINGITRERFGVMAIQGKVREIEKHVKDGIRQHGIQKMEDALRNELMEEFLKARKLPEPQKSKIMKNLKDVEILLKGLLK